MTEQNKRGTWTGPLAFILAASGSAIGLGNIWKFPFITGVNGGGAFVLIYLLCIAGVGLPLLAAEMVIGRMGGRGPVTTFATLAAHRKGGKYWGVFGVLAAVTAFLLLSYYSVVGGWTVAYSLKAATGTFRADFVDEIPAMFDTFVADGWTVLLYHFVFMAATVAVVIGGVRSGIERAAKILMPLLGLLLLILLVRSLFSEGAGEALTFMFYPDFSKLTADGVLEALGHAFFTLSLGMGSIIVYGSYLQKKESIFKAALAVGVLDTVIALVAGVMIFGIVFSFKLEPGAGPSLIFKTMPVLFAQMPGGSIFALLFFLLLAFAALTSAISILEVVVAWVVDREMMSRKVATLFFGGLIFLVGTLSAFSSSEIFAEVTILGKRSIFDSFDYLVSNWCLPLGGFGVALFAGRAVGRKLLQEELANDPWTRWLFDDWYAATRVVAPAAVIFVILNSLGVFKVKTAQEEALEKEAELVSQAVTIERCTEANWSDAGCEHSFPTHGRVHLEKVCKKKPTVAVCQRLAHFQIRGVGGAVQLWAGLRTFDKYCNEGSALACATLASLLIEDTHKAKGYYERGCVNVETPPRDLCDQLEPRWQDEPSEDGPDGEKEPEVERAPSK